MSEKRPSVEKEPGNQLPIKQHHIDSFSQIYGLDSALDVASMQKTYNGEGGVNPNTVRTVFPEGPTGKIHHEELLRCLGNFKAWDI